MVKETINVSLVISAYSSFASLKEHYPQHQNPRQGEMLLIDIDDEKELAICKHLTDPTRPGQTSPNTTSIFTNVSSLPLRHDVPCSGITGARNGK